MLAVAQSRARRGLPTPMIDERPQPPWYLNDAWEAWHSLHATRQAAMGPLPLTPADIQAWMDIQQVNGPDHRTELYFFITAMDSAWLAWANKKANGDTKTSN